MATREKKPGKSHALTLDETALIRTLKIADRIIAKNKKALLALSKY